MVQLEEVPDDELNAEQPGPKDDDDEWDTDTGMPLHYSIRIVGNADDP